MTTGQGNTGGVIGVGNEDRKCSYEEFSLGTTVIGSDGYPWVYVQANGAIAASQSDISVSGSFQASDGGGTYVGTTAFADNEYGWVRGPNLVAS